MASDIYAKPDFSKKVRYNRKQQEDTSDWEDCEVEIYNDAYESVEDTTGVQSPEQAPQTETCPKVQKRFCRCEQWRLLVLCTVLSAGSIILSSYMVVNNYNLQMEVKELKKHSEGINKTLLDEIKQLKNQIEDMVVYINNLQMEVKKLKNHFEGINKTLLDEIKQLKNQIEVFEGQWCPEGWKRFGRSCYYKSTEERNWFDSRDFCQFVGSDLVVVNSKEEQKEESWIGLFAGWSVQKYEWKWVDGSPLTETFWDERISKDPDYNNAVSLSADGKWTRQDQWNNYKNWICEKNLKF
ncbi:asialoglycoprotein receptor 1-like isoform X3 [Oryzias latipes]|uniref:asialoglycoprotein receptor 1-like isoform X3 n=1 Tax=Oryzias latipes TaxID=8090 RepID=UPI000CE26CBF|nr:asialoglycoprotein receptor 1-like isoform X3 [Oryzias latipes]